MRLPHKEILDVTNTHEIWWKHGLYLIQLNKPCLVNICQRRVENQPPAPLGRYVVGSDVHIFRKNRVYKIYVIYEPWLRSAHTHIRTYRGTTMYVCTYTRTHTQTHASWSSTLIPAFVINDTICHQKAKKLRYIHGTLHTIRPSD